MLYKIHNMHLSISVLTGGEQHCGLGQQDRVLVSPGELLCAGGGCAVQGGWGEGQG